MQPQYTRLTASPQDTCLETPGNTSFHVKEAKKAVAQLKLSLRRLQRCFSSHNTRRTIDPLCAGLDCAMGVLDSLPIGHTPMAGSERHV
jgi:hypothetical protein